MIFLKSEIVSELLNVETISVVALLLVACYLLIRMNNQTKKELEASRQENKEKDEMILGFLEKYYTIATKLYEHLKK